MILKGSQRGNAADLAIHLSNSFDNERVEVAQIYGTVSDDLYGAFAEFEAVAAGTRATKPLYSLSINPSSPLTREQYREAIATIEKRLGLSGQPHAIVFHAKADKHGIAREHCHVVWSRIDAAKMKAIHMSHDHSRLCDLSCELAHKYGLELPPGLKAWEEKNRRFDDKKLELSLAEKAQQDATGITPDQRRAEITAVYESADNAKAFRAALEQQGYILAAGSRRGFVVVDKFANVHSLSRYVQGHTAKAISAKLTPLTPADLPDVEQAKEIVRQRAQAQEEGEREQRLERQRQDAEQIAKRRAELEEQHRQRRAKLTGHEQDLLARQQGETLSLHAAQKAERDGLMFRARSAVADLIAKTPGLRSVLGPVQKLTGIDPRIRHIMERDALSRRHKRETYGLQGRGRALTRIETRERAALEKALKREFAPQSLEAFVQHQNASEQPNVAQDFHSAAGDDRLWQQRAYERGEVQVEFNDAAEFIEGADRQEDNGDDGKYIWKKRADESRRSQARKPRSRRGYRRDE